MTGEALGSIRDERLRAHRVTRSQPRYRIAFAIQRYFKYGGLQRDLRRVALACAERGHEAHILTNEWKGPRPKQLKVRLLPLTAHTNHGRGREFAAAVGKLIRRQTFDCVVGFNKMPGLDVYWAGDPCLAEHLRQNKHPFARWLPRYRTYLALEKAVMGDCSDAELLVLSEPEKERIVRHYGASESRLHLVPPGLDRPRLGSSADDRQAREVIRQELGIRDSDLMVLMVGSSFKTKGVDRALEAVHSLPEEDRRRTQLVVVGEGQSIPYQRLARRLNVGNRVIFTGGRDDVSDFYRAADWLLHPARMENTGLILLEAMFCGLPVLATECCGYAMHIRKAQGGLVCPHPFTQPVLNRLMAQMLSSDARRMWRHNGMAYCRQTDLYSMVDKTIDVIVARAARNNRATQLQGDARADSLAPLDANADLSCTFNGHKLLD